MKKRILSLLLIVSMLLTVLPANSVFAQETQVGQEQFSQWAFDELLVGDTYHIYPQSWYTKGMQKPITHAQMRILLSGIRGKINDTDKVVRYNEQRYYLYDNMTVEEVLEFLYILVSDYEFESSIGITEDSNALEFMAKYGIFTGNEGELALKDVCTVEQACVIGTRLITYLYDALDAASKGFLWEIESEGNTVYLLGSVHQASYDVYPFSNKMLKAFAESDVLGVEVDLLNDNMDSDALTIQYGVYNDGTTLKDHISEDLYQKTIQMGAFFGMTEEMLAFYKPWVLYSTFNNLANTLSTSAEDVATAQRLGIDLKFLLDAYLSGKPVIELESFELQIKMFDSFSDELEAFLLSSTLDGINDIMQGLENESIDIIEIILNYWHNGDVEGFMNDIAPIMLAAETPEMDEEDKAVLPLIDEYFNKIFTERDKGMAERIDAFLKSGGGTTYFVVVGTGHYISDYSVINILEDMGYEVNQIK